MIKSSTQETVSGRDSSRRVLENGWMLFDAVRFRNPPKSRRHCQRQPERLARGRRCNGHETKVVQRNKETTSNRWRAGLYLLYIAPCVLLSRASSGASLQGSKRFILHGAAVEHVEHVRVGRAASVAVVADEVVDAHARSAGRLGGGRRRSPAVATGRVGL